MLLLWQFDCYYIRSESNHSLFFSVKLQLCLDHTVCVHVCEWRCKDSVRHHTVAVNGSKYTFGLALFDCLQEFIEHFDQMPVVAGESGNAVVVAW